MRRVKSANVMSTDQRRDDSANRLCRLQSDLLLRILQYLHAQDLLALSVCSRYLYHKCASNELWIPFCEKEGVQLKRDRNSKSPGPWGALSSLSNKLKFMSRLTVQPADTDIPPGIYKKAYLKVLSNWSKNKFNSQSYPMSPRRGTVVRGSVVLAWSNSDITVITKGLKKTNSISVDNVESVDFIEGAAQFVCCIPVAGSLTLKTFSVDPLEPLQTLNLVLPKSFSFRDCLHGHSLAVSETDKVVVYNLLKAQTEFEVPVVESEDRFVEFDGFRIVACAKDRKTLESWNTVERTVRGVDQCTDFKVLSDIKQVIVFYVRWKCEVYNVDTMEKLETITPNCGDFVDVHQTLHYRARTLVALLGGPPGTGALFPVIDVWNLNGTSWVDKGVIMRGHVRDVGFISSHLFLCEIKKADKATGLYQIWHVRRAALLCNLSLPWDCNTTDRSLDPLQLNGSTAAVVTKDGVVVVDFN